MWNWLDPEGFKTGVFGIRWQNLADDSRMAKCAARFVRLDLAPDEASKSKGVQGPLFSPPIGAVRKAERIACRVILNNEIARTQKRRPADYADARI